MTPSDRARDSWWRLRGFRLGAHRPYRERRVRWPLSAAFFALLGAFVVSPPVHAGSDNLAAPKLNFHAQPLPLPDVQFLDESGSLVSLASFKGKLVLLNLWATWCVPCREEMPSLDRLQARLGGPNFAVVPLSLDRAGGSAVRQFFEELDVKNLPIYFDESGKSAHTLRAFGIPTTLLVTADGRELGRMVGPAEWDGPEAVATIQGYLDANAAGASNNVSEPSDSGSGPLSPTSSQSEGHSQVSAGERLYATHCASCHGKNLEGRPDWQSPLPNGRFRPPPHDDTGHTWHHADPLLFAITKDGLKPPIVPENYESDMPAFTDKLRDEEIWAVLAFIKSKWSAEARAYQESITENSARK